MPLARALSDALREAEFRRFPPPCVDAVARLVAAADPDALEAAPTHALVAAALVGDGGALQAARGAGGRLDLAVGIGSSAMTAVGAAAAGGNREILRELLRAGGVPGGGVAVDNSELEACFDGGDGGSEHSEDSAVSDFISVGEPPVSVPPLRLAASAGHAACIEFLAAAGADVHELGGAFNLSPLEAAVWAQAGPAVFAALVAAGADVSKHNEDGETPLYVAAADHNAADAVRALVAAGADLDVVVQGDIGTAHGTATHAVAARGQADMLRLLLELGASAAVVDGDGRTPLHAACERGKAECAQILIDAGADVFDADKSGLTPERAASKSGHMECARVIAAVVKARAEAVVAERLAAAGGGEAPAAAVNVAVAAAEFPRNGVSLRHLRDFAADIPPGLTTTQVVEAFVKPATAGAGVSWCEHHAADGGAADIAPATHFVSHSWRYAFSDLVDVVMQLEATEPESERVFVWVDILSVNQHRSGVYPEGWWATTFSRAVAEFGHTVLVLTPWDDPVPLKRSWCLWEILATLTGNARLDIRLPTAEAKILEEKMSSARTFGQITDSIDRVDVAQAEAWSPDDQAMILNAVRASEGGIGGVNSRIVARMQQWFIESGQAALRRIVVEEEQEAAAGAVDFNDPEARLRVARNKGYRPGVEEGLAGLLVEQGRPREAEPLLRSVLDHHEEWMRTRVSERRARHRMSEDGGGAEEDEDEEETVVVGDDTARNYASVVDAREQLGALLVRNAMGTRTRMLGSAQAAVALEGDDKVRLAEGARLLKFVNDCRQRYAQGEGWESDAADAAAKAAEPFVGALLGVGAAPVAERLCRTLAGVLRKQHAKWEAMREGHSEAEWTDEHEAEFARRVGGIALRLARVLVTLGETDEALALARGARQRCEAALGGKSSEALALAECTADALRLSGGGDAALREAADLYSGVASQREERRGAENHATANVLMGLAAAREGLDQTAEAAEAYERAAEAYEACFGAAHVDAREAWEAAALLCRGVKLL